MASGGESKRETRPIESKESDPLLRLFGVRVPVRQPVQSTPFQMPQGPITQAEIDRRAGARRQAATRPTAQPRTQGGGASKNDDSSSSSSSSSSSGGDRVMQNRIAELERDLAQVQAQRKALSEELLKTKKKLQVAAGPRRSARVIARNPGSEARRLRSDLSDAQGEIVNLQKALEDVSRQNGMTKEELKKAKQELNNVTLRLDNCTQERAALRGQVEALTGARNTLNDALQACLAEKRDLETRFATAQMDVIRLNKQLREQQRGRSSAPSSRGRSSNSLSPSRVRSPSPVRQNPVRPDSGSDDDDSAAAAAAPAPAAPRRSRRKRGERPENAGMSGVNGFTGAFAPENPEEASSSGSSAASVAASAAASGLNAAADVIQGATNTAAGVTTAAGAAAAAPLNAAAAALGGPSLREIVENTIPERIMAGNLRKPELLLYLASQTTPFEIRQTVTYTTVAKTNELLYTAILKYLYKNEEIVAAMLYAGYGGFPRRNPWRNSLSPIKKLRAIRRTIAPALGAAAAGGTPGLRILQSALRF